MCKAICIISMLMSIFYGYMFWSALKSAPHITQRDEKYLAEVGVIDTIKVKVWNQETGEYEVHYIPKPKEEEE